MLNKGNEEEEFATLPAELIDDQAKLFKYYRMSIE